MARHEPASGGGSSVKKKPLLSFERKTMGADVLVVTSGWPSDDNDTYCVFIKRQTESLIDRGLRCDVLFIRGYRSPRAYPLAAARLAARSSRRAASARARVSAELRSSVSVTNGGAPVSCARNQSRGWEPI